MPCEHEYIYEAENNIQYQAQPYPELKAAEVAPEY